MAEGGQRRRDRSNDNWEKQKDMTYCDRIYTTLTGKNRPPEKLNRFRLRNKVVFWLCAELK